MSISPEWGTAYDASVTALTRHRYPFDGEHQVGQPVALVFDPQSGGGFVLEGEAHRIAKVLDEAQRALAPHLAAEALAEWEDYHESHSRIMDEGGGQAADDFEDENLLDIAGKLAAALRGLSA